MPRAVAALVLIAAFAGAPAHADHAVARAGLHRGSAPGFFACINQFDNSPRPVARRCLVSYVVTEGKEAGLVRVVVAGHDFGQDIEEVTTVVAAGALTQGTDPVTGRATLRLQATVPIHGAVDVTATAAGWMQPTTMLVPFRACDWLPFVLRSDQPSLIRVGATTGSVGGFNGFGPADLCWGTMWTGPADGVWTSAVTL